jgi:hypothetical protein
LLIFTCHISYTTNTFLFRYCKGSVFVPKTSAVLVEAIDNGEGTLPRFAFNTKPVPEMPPFVKDKYSSPVEPMDARPIAFLMKRHQMQLTDDAGDLDIDCKFDLLDCLNSELLADLDPELKERIRQLSPEDRASLKTRILGGNQWSTEFTPAAMTCLNCNMAIYPVDALLVFPIKTQQ